MSLQKHARRPNVISDETDTLGPNSRPVNMLFTFLSAFVMGLSLLCYSVAAQGETNSEVKRDGATPGIDTSYDKLSGLAVEGNVIGYELWLERPFGGPLPHPLLMRLHSTKTGTSSLIVINWRFEVLTKEYADEHFGFNRLISFTVERNEKCDRKLKDLLFPLHDRELGGRTTFTLVAGVDKKSLPMDRKILCYEFAVPENRK